MTALNRYVPQYSTASLWVPTSSALQVGELAVNVIDGRLFTKDQNNNIILIGGTAISASYALVASLMTANTVTTWQTPTVISGANGTINYWTGSINPAATRLVAYSVSSSVYSRIRLYNSTANRDSDLLRATSSFASASSGLLLDVVCSGAVSPNGTIVYLSPPAHCYGGTLTPTASLGITINNLTQATWQVSGSLTYVSL